MIQLIKKLFKKYWTKENISYVFWGVLATLVSILVYYALIYFVPTMLEEVANAIAIGITILFAYWTNKTFVFHSKCPNFKSLLVEFWAFVSCRLVSAVIEELLLSFFIRAVHLNEYISKLVVCIFIFIINYVMSKLFIFNHKKTNEIAKKD